MSGAVCHSSPSSIRSRSSLTDHCTQEQSEKKRQNKGQRLRSFSLCGALFPFVSALARRKVHVYTSTSSPAVLLCHHVGGYGNAEGESTADMGRLCLALFEGGGQRSPLCTLSAAGKDAWVETRGRREDNDSYDGMTSVDAAQGDGEYGGDMGDRGGSHDRMGGMHGGRRYLEKAGH